MLLNTRIIIRNKALVDMFGKKCLWILYQQLQYMYNKANDKTHN